MQISLLAQADQCGLAGSESHLSTGGLDAEGTHRHLVARCRAPGDQQFLTASGYQTAQRDVVGLDHGGDAGAGALDPVGPVVVEMVGAHGNGVVKGPGVGNVCFGQKVLADDPPPFADADLAGDRCQQWVSRILAR